MEETPNGTSRKTNHRSKRLKHHRMEQEVETQSRSQQEGNQESRVDTNNNDDNNNNNQKGDSKKIPMKIFKQVKSTIGGKNGTGE